MKQAQFKQLILILLLTIFSADSIAVAGFSAINPGNVIVSANAEVKPPSVNELVNSFKSLSKSERKARIKEAKKEIKKFKQLKKDGAEPVAERAVVIICAILLPPLGVYLHEGEITSRFWISLLLTLLFFIPGMIYSLLVVTDSI